MRLVGQIGVAAGAVVLRYRPVESWLEAQAQAAERELGARGESRATEGLLPTTGRLAPYSAREKRLHYGVSSDAGSKGRVA